MILSSSGSDLTPWTARDLMFATKPPLVRGRVEMSSGDRPDRAGICFEGLTTTRCGCVLLLTPYWRKPGGFNNFSLQIMFKPGGRKFSPPNYESSELLYHGILTASRVNCIGWGLLRVSFAYPFSFPPKILVHLMAEKVPAGLGNEDLELIAILNQDDAEDIPIEIYSAVYAESDGLLVTAGLTSTEPRQYRAGGIKKYYQTTLNLSL